MTNPIRALFDQRKADRAAAAERGSRREADIEAAYDRYVSIRPYDETLPNPGYSETKSVSRGVL